MVNMILSLFPRGSQTTEELQTNTQLTRIMRQMVGNAFIKSLNIMEK